MEAQNLKMWRDLTISKYAVKIVFCYLVPMKKCNFDYIIKHNVMTTIWGRGVVRVFMEILLLRRRPSLDWQTTTSLFTFTFINPLLCLSTLPKVVQSFLIVDEFVSLKHGSRFDVLHMLIATVITVSANAFPLNLGVEHFIYST